MRKFFDIIIIIIILKNLSFRCFFIIRAYKKGSYNLHLDRDLTWQMSAH